MYYRQHNRIIHSIFFVFLSFGIGWLSWLYLWTIPFSICTLYWWFYAPNRWWGFLVIFAYCLGASHDVPKGGAVFFGEEFDYYKIIILWLSANTITAVLYGVLFSKKPHRQIIYLVLSLILTSIPPFGLFAVTHFVTASGILFPQTGLFGIGLFLVLVCSICIRKIFLIAPMVGLVLMTNVINPRPDFENNHYEIVQTSFKHSSADLDFTAAFKRIQLLLKIADQSKANILFYPETIAGKYTQTQQRLWVRENIDKHLYFGAEFDTQIQPLQRYDNVIIYNHKKNSQIIYKQRVPIPFAMWNPFAKISANSHWFDQTSVILADNKRASFLICYEILMVWPIIRDLFYRPNVIIGFSNSWWSKGTNLGYLQRLHLQSWARLMGITYYHSTNEFSYAR